MPIIMPPPFLSFEERLKHCEHPLSRRLMKCMLAKESNLCLSADVTSSAELLNLVRTLGPHICMLKTHIDIIEDFSEELLEELTRLSEEYEFFLFEDRKFADIGNTVQLQYAKGIYRIVEWAHLTNAHIVPGPGIIEALKQIGLSYQRALFLLAQMSSQGTLATEDYTQTAVALAEKHRNFVIGFICTEKLSNDPAFLHLTPGIKLHPDRDHLDQRYQSLEEAISQGTDIAIVGRDILNAPQPEERARQYRQQGWQAYLSRQS